MNTWIPVIVAALGGGGITALAALLVRKQGRKLTAEAKVSEASAADVLGKAAAALVEPLTKQLKDAEGRAERLNNQLAVAQTEVQQLRGDVDRLTKDLAAAREENDRLKGGA